jgi:hypothetical protein
MDGFERLISQTAGTLVPEPKKTLLISAFSIGLWRTDWNVK